uniref:Band 4.1 C-terminal domain-containing protein n=1 Tax=Anopheles stephensi TaxID=30069 RepID=A0A182YSJ8_ANOST
MGTNAKTQQLEEKTVATTTTQHGERQEQRVITQEVKTTATVTSGDQGADNVVGASQIPEGPNVEHRRVVVDDLAEGGTTTHGEIVSSQTVSSKTRTVETITYKTERDGVVETRVEQKITIQSDGDPIDHDKALAEAIQVRTGNCNALHVMWCIEKI